jgi:hypothetical protein
MMMKLARLNLVLTALLLSGTNLSAEPLPSGAKLPQASEIRGTYIGRTELWESDCGGGIYFGPRGEARAWCATKPDVFGAGTWSVDAHGRMCHNLRWYYKSGRTVGNSMGGQDCISHVSDRRGRIWRNWPGSNEWWLLQEGATVQRGYIFQNQIRMAKRKMGI